VLTLWRGAHFGAHAHYSKSVLPRPLPPVLTLTAAAQAARRQRVCWCVPCAELAELWHQPPVGCGAFTHPARWQLDVCFECTLRCSRRRPSCKCAQAAQVQSSTRPPPPLEQSRRSGDKHSGACSPRLPKTCLPHTLCDVCPPSLPPLASSPFRLPFRCPLTLERHAHCETGTWCGTSSRVPRSSTHHHTPLISQPHTHTLSPPGAAGPRLPCW
jgi:hypothetical protein